MIDVHTHILYDVDDGSDTLEESIAILKKAIRSGVTDIILTPHYTDKSEYDKSKVDSAFKVLKEKVNELNLDVKLYLGNEIAVYGNINEILSDENVSTLAGSKYMLIEFPMSTDVSYVIDTIYEIKLKGYIPVIAHPERCECFKKNEKLIEEAVNHGALLQCNTGSIIEQYGKTAKRIVTKLLKEHLVTFLATDEKREKNSRYDELLRVEVEVEKLIGRYESKKLLIYNARKLLINEDIIEEQIQ